MNICKFLKRSLSLLLVLMMCVSLMSLSAFAANEETPTQYACGLEEHKHTDECYETQTVKTLICDLEEIEGHQHDSSCYETQTTETEESVLTCDEEHDHTEDCYEVQTVEVEEEVLTCQLAEAEGHTHSEDCYDTTTVTTLACGKEEHTHTAQCCEVYAGLSDALQTLGDKFSAFQVEFFDSLTGDEEDPMDAFAAAAAEQFGEEFNALLALYQQIPEELADDPAYADLTGALEMFANAMGGDLNSGVQLLTDEAQLKSNIDKGGTVTLDSDVNVLSTIVISKDVTLNLNGHTITYTGKTGSVFKVTNNATFTLNGNGTITGGKGTTGIDGSVTSDQETSGGGVLVQSGTFTMNGGTITGNSASRGGGIYVAMNACLNIYGGTISNNHATGTTRGETAGNFGGGGIWINGTAVIDPTVSGGSNILIQNNTSAATKDLGGGAIYVNSNYGTLTLVNAEITNNYAAGLGGGIATCLHGKVAQSNIESAAIYANNIKQNVVTNNGVSKVDGTKDTPTNLGNTVDASKTWMKEGYEAFIDAAVDILSAGDESKTDSQGHPGGSAVSELMLGGGTHGWSGYAIDSADGELRSVAPASNGMVYGGYAMGLTATNRPTVDIAGRKVLISGNISASHGGAIGCNGILRLSQTINNVNVNALDGALTLTINKSLTGAAIANNSFTFELVKEDGTSFSPKITATTNQTGVAVLDYTKAIDPTTLSNGKTYTFLVKESTGTDPVNYDQTQYRVVVTVKKGTVETGSVVYDHATGATQQVTTTHYTATAAITKDGSSVTGNLQFTNTWKTGSLTIDKTVVSPTALEANEKFTFEVTLEDNTKSGITMPTTLTDTNGTTYQVNDGKFTVTIAGSEFKLENGRGSASVTINGIPAGLTYTVSEKDADKWAVTGQNDQSYTIDSNGSKVEITDTLKTVNLAIRKTVSWDETSSQAYVGNDDFKFDVTLTYPNGTQQTKQVSVTKDSTTTIATEVPLGTTYTIKETSNVEGFTYVTYDGTKMESVGATYTGTIGLATENESTVTIIADNRYFQTKTTRLTVTKDWNGGESYKPASVEVELVGGPNTLSEPDRTATLTADGNWSKTWTDLPMYASEGTPYTYSVKETGVSYPALGEGETGLKADALIGSIIRVRDTANIGVKDKNAEIVGGWLVSNGDSVTAQENSTITISNKWLGKTEAVQASITIHKVDADNNNVSIPDVTFTLEKDGEATKTETTGDNGEVTFTGLTQGTYTLTETVIHEGYLATEQGRTWTIIIGRGNELQSVKVLNEDGKDDQPVGENTWSWTDSDGTQMPDKEGEISWTATDDCLGGTLTITNQIIKGQISVTKVLNLDGVTEDITGDPADKVFTFEVYADEVFGVEKGTLVATLEVQMGETKTTDPLRYGTYIVEEVGNPEELTNYQWQFVTYTQDSNDSNDSAIEEMVRSLAKAVTDAQNEVLGEETEEDVTTVSANTVMVGKQDEIYDVTATNHYKRDLGELSISKTVQGDLGDRNREWNFTVTLTSPEAYVNLLNPAYAYTYTIATKDNQGNDVYEYEYQLDDDGNLVLDDDGNPVLVLDEDGNPVVKVYPLEQVVEEDPEQPEESAEPVSVIYAITLKHGQTAHIVGIPVGTTYEVTEAEANKDGYSTSTTDNTGVIVTSATEAKFYNSRWSVPTTSLTVNKVWDDEGHEDERPDSIQVQLYRNGNAYGEVVTLSVDNGWSHRWTGLSTIGTWTVEELNVPHGYTVTMEQSNTVVTITNTYEEEEDEDLDDPDVPLAEMPDDPEESDDSDDSDNSDGPDEEFLDDPDVPLAGVPDMPEEEELDDPDVPLAEMPGAPEEEELDEPDVPLVEMPDAPEEEELTDLDVPLAEVPKTGDRSGLWYALSAAAAAGLLGLTAVERKKREED